MRPPESTKGLWYNTLTNRFEDGTGAVIHDLSLYFPVWELDLWKKTKDYAILTDRQGKLWELFYNNINQYGKCKHLCNKCSVKCEIYDMVRD